MNGKIWELWGDWFNTALKGQNQMDMLNGWWLNSVGNMSLFDGRYAALWGLPVKCNPASVMVGDWIQAWEPIFKLQQLSFQWMGMVPKKKYDALSDRVDELEGQIQEQTRTIERLRHLLSTSGSEGNAVVAQLQDLIGQQSQQFKQLSTSVTDYIKSGSEKANPKK